MSRLLGLMLWILILLCSVGFARAELWLVDDKLAIDAMVWSGAHWWRSEQAGLTKSNSGFERVAALVGLTGRLGRVATFRASGDVGYLQPQDLYVDLRWAGGFGLRAGQFRMPLGMDAMAEPDSQKLSGNSILVNYAKPAGVRDIGVLGSWSVDRFSLSAAVVNGAGANAGDNNDRKDLCARLTFVPLAQLDAVIALRSYYGWSDSLWHSTAVETRVRRGPLTLQTELQNLRSRYANNSAYLLVALEAGVLEPVGRLDLVLAQGRLTEWMLTGGLDARPMSRHLGVMLAFSYHRNYPYNWGILGFSVRLQAVL